jgi:hypothetical protein
MHGSGAGKTTLLALIVGLLAPAEGQVAVLGSVSRANTAETLARVSYLAQDHPLYRGTRQASPRSGSDPRQAPARSPAPNSHDSATAPATKALQTALPLAKPHACDHQLCIRRRDSRSPCSGLAPWIPKLAAHSRHQSVTGTMRIPPVADHANMRSAIDAYGTREWISVLI